MTRVYIKDWCAIDVKKNRRRSIINYYLYYISNVFGSRYVLCELKPPEIVCAVRAHTSNIESAHLTKNRRHVVRHLTCKLLEKQDVLAVCRGIN